MVLPIGVLIVNVLSPIVPRNHTIILRNKFSDDESTKQEPNSNSCNSPHQSSWYILFPLIQYFPRNDRSRYHVSECNPSATQSMFVLLWWLAILLIYICRSRFIPRRTRDIFLLLRLDPFSTIPFIIRWFMRESVMASLGCDGRDVFYWGCFLFYSLSFGVRVGYDEEGPISVGLKWTH
jgi:hypothetical protein